ncbi:hypothetical protein BC937DRAFT_92102 [Endogone sp. FLAS-F59071]|nr:hypothetical protein BC937DRAFT_92102 [Endogone sp. FLAS-F59071]|eukprot:RUS21621.1 hypothetical protein BC937DRAFT_92102 [Endogone sp. FLAS-F59071]
MFVLALINDTVNIEPARFVQPKHVAITEELNKKYANKEVGLCVCTHDIIEASEEFIHYGDGCSYFRMVVFRPFIGEVMTGKVKSCTSSGVKGEYYVTISLPMNSLSMLQRGVLFGDFEAIFFFSNHSFVNTFAQCTISLS